MEILSKSQEGANIKKGESEITKTLEGEAYGRRVRVSLRYLLPYWKGTRTDDDGHVPSRRASG